MGKKIVLPPEYRGGRIGSGWYEDDPNAEPDHYEDVRELAKGLLLGKMDEIWATVRRNKEMRNGQKMDSGSN